MRAIDLFCGTGGFSRGAHAAGFDVVSKSPAAIVNAIKFQPAEDLEDARKAVASYKRLHRFYPTFLSIGVQ